MEDSLRHIYIYGDGSSGLNLEDLSSYLRKLFPPINVEVRVDFFTHCLRDTEINPGLDRLAERLASIRVLDPMKEGLNPNPIYGEIDYERRKLLNPYSRSIGVFYDGIRLQSLLYPLIREKGSGALHIVFTNQLIVTWDDSDRRYHLRVNVLGQPSIISTSGIVEAPAKPREFYIMKQMVGTEDISLLKKGFAQRFIDYEDMRINDVIKGYLAHAVFYHVTGEPFCDDRGCRLFNAHWQEELIYAQIESPYEFCDRHVSMIAELKNPPPSPFSKGGVLIPLFSKEG